MNNSVRKLRRSKDISQAELAQIVGCRRETIINLEAGRFSPSWEMVYRISRALDVCPCMLMLPDYPELCEGPSYLLID